MQKQFENGRYEYAIEGMKINKKIIEQQILETQIESIFNHFIQSRLEKAEKVQKQFENGRYEYAIEGMKISKKIIEQQIQATLNAGASLRNNRPSNSRV